MKKTILALTVAGLMVGSISTAVAQKADKKATEARKDLKEAKQDSVAEIQKFKKKSNEEITENKAKIEKLKMISRKETAEDKAKYDKKIVGLEEKNNALMTRLNAYTISDKSKWTSFKSEFKHDMDGLGRAIKDIGVDNKK